jgi:hypothetical protein
MRSRLRWALVAVGLAVVVAVGGVVFWPRPKPMAAPEAVYEGNPTSWWASHCQTGRLDEQSFGGPSGVFMYQPAGRYLNQGESGDEHYVKCLHLLEGQPEAVPVLLELLNDLQTSVHEAAAYGLARAYVNCDSPEAHAALMAALHDNDLTVRMLAAGVLHQQDPTGAAKAGVPDSDVAVLDVCQFEARDRKLKDLQNRQRLPFGFMTSTIAVLVGVPAFVVWWYRRKRQRWFPETRTVRRRWLLWLLTGLAATCIAFAVVTVASWPEPESQSSPITSANFRRVKKGMTREEVTAILGTPGINCTGNTEFDFRAPIDRSPMFGDPEGPFAHQIEFWWTDTGNAWVAFDGSGRAIRGFYMPQRLVNDMPWNRLIRKFKHL